MFYKLLYIGQSAYKKRYRHLAYVINVMKRILFSCNIPSSCEIDKTVKFSHSGIGVIIHSDAKVGKNTIISPHVVIGERKGTGDRGGLLYRYRSNYYW